MLQNLTISNYALIDQLEFNPSLGLSIVTGETGAGKSIMLGAVGLLIGNRADTKVLLDTGKKCVIEGEYDVSEYNLQGFFKENDLDYEDTAIIRREISPSGKSRGFVNDTPVNLEIMRALGTYLMDIHSQNDTLQLGSASFQLKIVDAFADTLPLFEEFQSAYHEYDRAKSKYSILLREEAQIKKESDFNIFLLDELEKAAFQEGEQEKLEEQQEILAHSEEIKKLIQQASLLISLDDNSVLSGFENLVQILRQLSKYSSHYSELSQRMDSVLIELNDIRGELEKEDEKIEHNPERISEVQERISMLYHLFQKHSVTGIGELLKIQEELSDNVSRFHNLDEELSSAKNNLEEKEKQALIIANNLSEKRRKSFDSLCSSMIMMLNGLGMPNATINIDHEKVALNPNGLDQISILFSANKGVAPQPLKAVASGGEFSRLMFCIKYLLAQKTAMPTLIFDEIDTGVSGEIALQLGNMMRKMAKNHQVISISHLPQMAAKADRHFHVFKDHNSSKAISKIRLLSDSERVEEIAKMIAGDNPTSSAFASARELIESK